MESGTSTTEAVGPPSRLPTSGLSSSYRGFLDRSILRWIVQYRLVRRLGAGGQGVVFLAERLGMDGLTVPVALKVFSPDPYANEPSYRQDMLRISRVAARVVLIQQDHLLDVHNFLDYDGVRVMTMEWVDGYDLKHLLDPVTSERLRANLSEERWEHLRNVVFSPGLVHLRLKPGIANSIVRECLAALAALHREGIVHGDVKPSNVMLKRTGNTKLIDLGSAVEVDHNEGRRPFTPEYAAPEVLRGGACTPASDLASLGYVLIQMLAGASPFDGMQRLDDLLAAKERLPGRLGEFLPEDVTRNELLMRFLHQLIANEPQERFPDGESADLLENGAASFEQQLVRGNLAMDFRTEIRLWLDDLKTAIPSEAHTA